MSDKRTALEARPNCRNGYQLLPLCGSRDKIRGLEYQVISEQRFHKASPTLNRINGEQS